MSRTTINDLGAVVAVARRGSFRAAAVDLGMSTTALSQAVAKLETSLGVRLFNRTTRSVALTDAGRQFVEAMGPALEDIRGAMEAVRSHRETPTGLLRINAAPVAASEILSPLVLEFLRRYPDMTVDLVSEGRLVDIVADGFDLGVRFADLVPSDMIAVSLGRPQRFAVVGTPQYFAEHPRPLVPTDVLAHRCVRVRLPDGAIYRWHFEKGAEVVRIDARGPIILGEASLARTAVLDGIGLGFFMEQNVRAEIEAGRLVRVLDDWTPPFPGLSLYYPGRRNTSAGLRAFLALARELARGDER
ncbi:LysR family transcriptional regulator [Acuticoccus sediminis]|uniref:LysR family transcriptional regulator n=1 Tax=Acuticoccus sediminis TaxID=2184697 RepID=A0A8B2NUQ7_9HYPH|nr:LysR family transcriptional regulator [Acuticoccus sediminis]RAI02028.1 LysR family transcriptional regulator [Acuticoccus sediminis]